MEKSVQSESGIPWALTLGALGVVYGDIGTSPLYAIRECFSSHSGLAITQDNILGVLSLIFWTLVIVISIKYLLFVMRADNRGEGGVLALTALAVPQRHIRQGSLRWLAYLGLIGAALLYADGIITPAISVLSAVEGLAVATPYFEPHVVPITICILFALFFIQKRGTSRIGAIFGPIILIWFSTLGILGLAQAVSYPVVFTSLSPHYAFNFFLENRMHGFFALGAVFLVATGGEALYADMGHFGRRPIQIGWFFVALPGLLLNYMGQGALLLRHPEAISNPFYNLVPTWGLYPLVILATCATVIASQAVISGAFSATRQAVQLGYLPRLAIVHTSSDEIGQIYVAPVNWFLLFSTIWMVFVFPTSSSLAGAYGIAVSTTMVITTILLFRVARYRLRMGSWTTAAITIPFLLIELGFLSANFVKVFDGGYVPLLIAVGIVLLMTTWRRGREILGQRLEEKLVSFDTLLPQMLKYPRIKGTAIFMTRNIDRTPPALLHNIKHNKIVHEQVVLLLVEVEEVPHVPPEERLQIEMLQGGFCRIIAHFGYMDDPDIPAVLARLADKNVSIDLSDATYFIGRETLLATPRPGMAIWREKLFALMSRNAQSATLFFKLPCEHVVEVGLQVEL